MAEKIGLLNRDFGSILSVLPRKNNANTQSSLNFLQSGPRKFSKSDFSGLAPIWRVLKEKKKSSCQIYARVCPKTGVSAPGSRVSKKRPQSVRDSFLTLWGHFLDCESVRPLQGSKSPKLGKEGLEVKKLPFPSVPEMSALSQENPIFLDNVEPCREMGIF